MASPVVETEKNVLILGKSGSGKSRLINVLARRDLAVSRSSSVAVTQIAEIHTLHFGLGTDSITRVNLIDTRGFADADYSDEELVQQVKDFLGNPKTRTKWLNLIIVVMREGRITPEEVCVETKMKLENCLPWPLSLQFVSYHESLSDM